MAHISTFCQWDSGSNDSDGSYSRIFREDIRPLRLLKAKFSEAVAHWQVLDPERWAAATFKEKNVIDETADIDVDLVRAVIENVAI